MQKKQTCLDVGVTSLLDVSAEVNYVAHENCSPWSDWNEHTVKYMAHFLINQSREKYK